MKKFLNLLIITTLLFASCDKDSVAIEEPVSAKELNGDELFKDLFFYLGDEVKEIPSFAEQVNLLEKAQAKNDKFLSIYAASADNYLAKVKANNPSFINELKIAVQHKDFEQIKSAMAYGGQLITAIATIDALQSVKDEKIASSFAKLTYGNYDLTSSKGLALLFADTDAMMKSSGYDFEAIHRAAELAPLNYNYTYNYNYNYNYAYVQVYHYNLDYNFQFVRYLNFVNNFNYHFNYSFSYVNNIISPLESGVDYDSYSGEELIDEIAFAF